MTDRKTRTGTGRGGKRKRTIGNAGIMDTEKNKQEQREGGKAKKDRRCNRQEETGKAERPKQKQKERWRK